MREAGDMAGFAARALVELRGVWRYAAEILRQTAILITGTTLILAFLTFVVGGSCGLFGVYFLRSAGASSYVGLFTNLCGIRGLVDLMFGYVFAAKVGCGLVAEIGSMRISEELDAFESTGTDPMRYVVGTRLAAAFLFMPFAFMIGAVANSFGAYTVSVVQIAEVSQAGFESVHWGLQSVQDNLITLIRLCTIGTFIVLVATYYGYRVRGGPAEVGAAVARSMVVNLVMIHVIAGALISVFYGADTRLPIGG